MIGAGAAGLAASRQLLGQGLRPSIFEAAKTVGGAWSSSSNNSKMWDDLTTNLSKHTCRFSELPWPESTTTFPTATEMQQYLERYSAEFVDPSCFQYECQVTNVESLNGGDNGYRVEWLDLNDQTKHSKEFEGVVVATGFFSKPHYPEGLDAKDSSIIHSKDYQSHEAFANETVAVVGSSFSALEIAVDVSQSAKRVVSVLPRIPWVVPRLLPQQINDTVNYASPTILPVDLAFYRRAKDAPQIPEATTISPAWAQERHSFLQSTLGPRQKNSPLGIPQDFDKPPMVAISDFYLDLVVDGSIDVIKGRLQGMDLSTGLQIESSERSWVLPNITKVICCTGYESNLENYLEESILSTIEYDGKDTFCPMTLCWDTIHPKLSNFAFCGMYRGPYMGIMELQGRLAAAVMSGKIRIEEEKLQTALSTSQQIRSQHPATRPQFPHFDYIGFMDSLAELMKDAGIQPKHNIKKGEMISPVFYQASEKEAFAGIKELEQEIQTGQDGSRMSSLVMSALIGSWKFDRTIVHKSEDRLEHVYGTIKYSRPKLDYVLYREDGLYELSPSKTLSVFREYEYLVKDDTLEIYFVESGKRAHMFLSLKFKEKNSSGYWVATSDHLCIKDLYSAKFQVKLDGLAATEIIITYRVKGPSKDYESTTYLTPLRQQ